MSTYSSLLGRTLNGKVTDTKGQSSYNARVYITNSSGVRLYDNKYDARTDSDGIYSIALPPELFRTERWIRVQDSLTKNKSGSKIKSGQDAYMFTDIDKGGLSQDLNEVTVTVKTPKTICEERGGTYNPTTKECKVKSKWGIYFIVGGVGLLALGLIIYGATRKK